MPSVQPAAVLLVAEPAEAPLVAPKILKFGGSVLKSVRDLPRVAGEIYRQARDGSPVIAVVSAFEGETDQLLRLCELAGRGRDVAGTPNVVSLGEEKTAHLLGIACAAIGLSATVLRPETLGIRTEGAALESLPIALGGAIAAVAARAGVVIVPGFVGVDYAGDRTLLGRGGTDFTAIFIAGETGGRLRLYKDVDGVYDHDPARDRAHAHALRYAEVSWQDCLTIARPLLQPRAVEYASRRHLEIEVGAIGGASPTRVGPRSRAPAAPRSRPRLRIGLAGFGTVGQALQERLERECNFEIAAILVRDLARARRIMPARAPTTESGAFFSADFDILVDVTSGDGGKAAVLRQLARGRDVVSANKRVIAENYATLHSLAAQWGGALRYAAAVGGSAPMIEAARSARATGAIVAVTGILNGTVNFLLDRLADGAGFEIALDEARRAGFAEEDPESDLSGADAALKLRIIAAEIWGEEALTLPIETAALTPELCAEIAASGERWVQLATIDAVACNRQAAIRFVRARDVTGLPTLAGERNHLCVVRRDGEMFTASGRGAGGEVTAEAILADLYEIAAIRRNE